MNKYENLGVTTIVSDDKLSIEISIDGLVDGFNFCPNNYDDSTIKGEKYQEFANYIAKALIDGSNPDTGNSPVMTMVDSIFEDIFEGAEDFVKYGDEE